MPSTQYFDELYGVTEEGALNFWASHLHDVIGSKQWSEICDSTGVYLASVLGHFCLQSVDRMEILPPDNSTKKDLHPIYRLQAKMTKHACKIDPRRVANLGPLLTSYHAVEMGGPEVKSSFFRDTIQLVKILSRWHIRNPRPWVSRTICLFISFSS